MALPKPVRNQVSCAPTGRGLRLPGLSRLPRYEFDREYVDRLVHEDPETENHFTRYFGDLLSLKLRSKLRSATAISDAKQETFLRVLTTLKIKGGLATPESLGAFVNSVANNVVFELYRKDAKVAPLAEDHDEPDTKAAGADTTLMAHEERSRVREALADLPQKEKELLFALFFEECDKDELCQKMGVDRDYLRVLLHRAKKRFRSRYESN